MPSKLPLIAPLFAAWQAGVAVRARRRRGSRREGEERRTECSIRNSIVFLSRQIKMSSAAHHLQSPDKKCCEFLLLFMFGGLIICRSLKRRENPKRMKFTSIRKMYIVKITPKMYIVKITPKGKMYDTMKRSLLQKKKEKKVPYHLNQAKLWRQISILALLQSIENWLKICKMAWTNYVPREILPKAVGAKRFAINTQTHKLAFMHICMLPIKNT